MDISIVIVNWNTKEMLSKCLESIYDGVKGLSFEIWVVDNGSADGSSAMVKERFPDVKLIENASNLGFSRANNQALKYISGGYAVLLNSDTILIHGAIETLRGFMEKNPQAGISGPQLLNEDGSRQNSIANIPTLATELFNKSLLRRINPEKYPGKELDIKGPMEVESIIGACMVVRKKAMEEVGPLDEDYFFFLEETDWSKRFGDKGWKVFFHPEAKIYHLQGVSAKKVNIRARIEYWRSRYMFFHKHATAAERAILKIGLLARVLVNLTVGILYNIATLFIIKKARERLKLNSTILLWHIRGCPDGWGLQSKGDA